MSMRPRPTLARPPLSRQGQCDIVMCIIQRGTSLREKEPPDVEAVFALLLKVADRQRGYCRKQGMEPSDLAAEIYLRLEKSGRLGSLPEDEAARTEYLSTAAKNFLHSCYRARKTHMKGGLYDAPPWAEVDMSSIGASDASSEEDRDPPLTLWEAGAGLPVGEKADGRGSEKGDGSRPYQFPLRGEEEGEDDFDSLGEEDSVEGLRAIGDLRHDPFGQGDRCGTSPFEILPSLPYAQRLFFCLRNIIVVSDHPRAREGLLADMAHWTGEPREEIEPRLERAAMNLEERLNRDPSLIKKGLSTKEIRALFPESSRPTTTCVDTNYHRGVARLKKEMKGRGAGGRNEA
jgi:DNA-directed RNA polymerase specialized sigma24 family protein